jgi:hypothetical protein
VEWLLNTMLDGHVEAITAFRRNPKSDDSGPAPLPTATPPAAPKASGAAATPAKLLERNVVEATFLSTPGAARRVINQIAGANQLFCVIRVLHVHDDKDKGPPREAAGGTTTAIPTPVPASGTTGAKPTPSAALNFIVGNEKVETTARIEIVRFTL